MPFTTSELGSRILNVQIKRDADIEDIFRAIEALDAKGGGCLRVSTNANRWYNLRDGISVPERVQVMGICMPKLRMTNDADHMFDIQNGAVHSQVKGFNLDGNGKVKKSFINAGNDYERVEISCNRIFDSRSDGKNENHAITSGNGKHLQIFANDAENVKKFYQPSGSRETDVYRNRAAKLTDRGGLVRYTNGVHNLRVYENNVYGNADNAVGGQLITAQSSKSSTDHVGVYIYENHFEGREGVAFDEKKLQSNGATADMISIKNTIDFDIRDNVLKHSGSYGIVIADGSRDGYVSRNSLKNMDNMGICLGVPGYKNTVINVHVKDNRINDVGADILGQSNDQVNSGIRVWDTDRCSVWGNNIDGAGKYGIYIRSVNDDEKADFGKRPNTKFTHGNNTVSNSGLADFEDLSPVTRSRGWHEGLSI